LIDDTADADATNTHSKEPVQVKEKVTLEFDTPEFAKALTYMIRGGDIELIEKKYKLTYEVKQALLNNK
jgi:hypothetical protein